MIDDCSDPAVDLARPDVTVLRNARHEGVHRSLRRGCAAARGDVLVVLDAHMSFRDDWLPRMLAELDPETLLCPAALSYDLATPYYWGANWTWIGSPVPRFHYEHRCRRPSRAAVDVPMVLGACYMLHRAAYERLGGFSPLYRVWGLVEQDLSLRAWIAGMRVRCATRAGVGHFYRKTLPTPVTRDQVFYNNLVLVQTVFERPVADLLLPCFEPCPPQVRSWLDDEDVAGWRQRVQQTRAVGDAELFAGPLRRCAASLPVSVGATVRYRRGRLPSAVVRAWVRDEEVATSRRLPDPPPRPPGDARPASVRGIGPGARRRLLVRAGVVARNGRAIVLLGGERGGIRALVVELVRAGAEYYSQSYAALDGSGRVTPHAAPLALHAGDGGQAVWAAEDLGGRPGRGACPIGLVAAVRCEPGRPWRLAAMSRGEAVLALLARAEISRAQRGRALRILRRAVAGARAVSVLRGSARSGARWLLRCLEDASSAPVEGRSR